MKSPLLLFLGLSAATHAAMMTWHANGKSITETGGQQLQVSLLSGEVARSSVTASRAGGDFGDSTSISSKTSGVEGPAPGKRSAPVQSDRQHEQSTKSIQQSAVTPSSGKRLSVELSRLVDAKFSYPSIARRLGYQGRVLVNVSISPDGTITGTKLERSSGHRSLDLAALDSIRSIGRAPQLRQWLQGQAVSINVPVTYRLLGT